MAEKTALKKLYSYIHVAHDLGAKEVHTLTIMKLINELIELEKEQIINAHNSGKNILPPNENGEQYYNETYNK